MIDENNKNSLNENEFQKAISDEMQSVSSKEQEIYDMLIKNIVNDRSELESLIQKVKTKIIKENGEISEQSVFSIGSFLDSLLRSKIDLNKQLGEVLKIFSTRFGSLLSKKIEDEQRRKQIEEKERLSEFKNSKSLDEIFSDMREVFEKEYDKVRLEPIDLGDEDGEG